MARCGTVRRAVLGLAVAVVACGVAAAAADPLADQVRKVRDKVAPSTVIVSFTIERDDGAKADIRLLGTVVGGGNLVLVSNAAFPSEFALSQFKEFKAIVTQGDDLKEYGAEYLGKDDQAQVAFLKVSDPQAPALPVLGFDEKVTLDVGDAVVSVGNVGEPDGYARVFQVARVAARLDQPVTTYVCSDGLGSPGTPVATLDGKVAGLIGLVRLNQATNARPKWSLAKVVWPTERFLERLKDPPKGGKAVKVPWLGAETLTAVTKDLAEYFKLGERRGVVVGQVIENSPAAKAGLRAEDIILAVNGEAIKGTEGQLVENFSNDIRQRNPGETVDLDVWREGKVVKVKARLEERPKIASEAQRFRSDAFGLTVRELVLADRVARDMPASEGGVVVAFLDPAGWAYDGGLRPGDVIKKVQDKDTPNLAEFRKVFQAETKDKPKEIVLFVLRGKKDTQLVRIEPRW